VLDRVARGVILRSDPGTPPFESGSQK